MKNDANMLLAALGEALSLEGLALDENACAEFSAGGIPMCFLFDEDADCLALQALTGTLPEKPATRQRLMREMLAACHLGGQTDGAALGVDADSGLATLQKRWMASPAMEAGDFLDAFARFFSIAQGWQKKLASAASEPSPLDPFAQLLRA